VWNREQRTKLVAAHTRPLWQSDASSRIGILGAVQLCMQGQARRLLRSVSPLDLPPVFILKDDGSAGWDTAVRSPPVSWLVAYSISRLINGRSP
jgi:hypothetical protein